MSLGSPAYSLSWPYLVAAVEKARAEVGSRLGIAGEAKASLLPTKERLG